jgi:predicted Zn-dependent peptidase
MLTRAERRYCGSLQPGVSNTASTPSAAAVVVNNTSAADELKKFKELLDGGIISQEEFDAKKKQLLGL